MPHLNIDVAVTASDKMCRRNDVTIGIECDFFVMQVVSDVAVDLMTGHADDMKRNAVRFFQEDVIARLFGPAKDE